MIGGVWIICLAAVLVERMEACPPQCSCSDVKNPEGDEGVLGKKMVCRGDATVGSINQLSPAEWDPTIIYLDLSGNEITYVRRDSFSRVQSLHRLNLSGNAISGIEPRAFTDLTHLQRLDLSSNQITSLNSSIFSGLEKLERLDLSSNQIVSLNRSAFTGLQQLERLYLGGNKLRSLPGGLFNPLPQLKRLDVRSAWLSCDCHVAWLADWWRERKVRISDATKCQLPVELKDTPFKELTKDDLHCDRPVEIPDFTLTPNRNQIVFQGDKLRLRCKATVTGDNVTLTWLREGQKVTDNKAGGVLVYNNELPDGTFQTHLVIERLSVSDNGVWQCKMTSQRGTVTPLSVNVVVLDNSTIYCPEETTHTPKGTFVWSKTMASTEPSIECPFGKALGYAAVSRPKASYRCNRVGEWEELDVTQCQYENEVTRALEAYARANFRNISMEKVIHWSTHSDIKNNPELIEDTDAVIFMTQTLKNFVEQADPTQQLGGLVVDLISMMMDVEPRLLYSAQSQQSSLSKTVKALEELVPKMMKDEASVSVFAKNIAVHGFEFDSEKFKGLVCKAFKSNPDVEVAGTSRNKEVMYNRDNFVCEIPGQKPLETVDATRRKKKELSASIEIPASIFTDVRCLPAVADCQQGSKFRIEFIVYRHAALFPVRARRSGRQQVHTPVIAAKIVGAPVTNTTDPIVIKLSPSQPGFSRTAVYWEFQADGEFGRWFEHGCKIVKEEEGIITAHSSHLTNFAVMQSLEPLSDGWEEEHWLLDSLTMSPFVYAGSFVLSVCTIATLVTYLLCRRAMSMPKKLKHCVPNMCLGMLLLCVTFTFGIHTRDPPLLCKTIGIALHYLSICLLLWIAITAYIMYKKFEKFTKPPVPRDPDAPISTKPVLGLYLIGWGLGLILCGIVAAINSLQHYDNGDYCFLTPGAQVFAFYVPALILLLVSLVFFLCICCTVNGAAALREDPETEDLNVTEIDTVQPETSSVARTVAQQSAQQSALVNLSRSDPDLQYKPLNQLLGLAAVLLLFLVTWGCAAMSVALPINIVHEDIIFNCLYLFTSSALGVFLVVFFVFGRADGRTAWHNACCCVKTPDFYDVRETPLGHRRAMANGSVGRTARAMNGHLVHSASSLEGSNCTSNHTRRSNNVYQYGAQNQSNLSIVHSNPPTVTDSSITAIQEYPNFINPKQNGIAKRYWRKRRQKTRLFEVNTEYFKRFEYDSDQNGNMREMTELKLQPQPYLKESATFGMQQTRTFYQVPASGEVNGLRPPLLPTERYHFAPIVGLSSPASTLLPPDGGSCMAGSLAGAIPTYDSYSPLPPPPLTSPVNSSHSLPRPNPVAPHVHEYMRRNGTVPRLRDFDGKSSTSKDTRDTRPLSVGSDSHMTSLKRPGKTAACNSYKVPPVPPKRSTNPQSGRDGKAHVSDKSHKATELVALARSTPKKSMKETAFMNGEQRYERDNNRVPLLANINANCNNSSTTHDVTTSVQTRSNLVDGQPKLLSGEQKTSAYRDTNRTPDVHPQCISDLLKQSSLPYAYVNHSYQEKMMNDLMQSSECAALLAQDKGPDWMPRSVSGYDRITGGTSNGYGRNSVNASDGEDSESSVDSLNGESGDDVWVPQKRMRRKLSNKETCV